MSSFFFLMLVLSELNRFCARAFFLLLSLLYSKYDIFTFVLPSDFVVKSFRLDLIIVLFVS